MQIINSNSDQEKEIKMKPEMLNLLGCNKDNFKKLLKLMNYKILEKNNEVFFRYFPRKVFKKSGKKIVKESPFGVLKNLNLN
jgi:ATP-dependent RNA helicase SUPV3L1/SUV3